MQKSISTEELTAPQIRAARGLLRMEQGELARRVGISRTALQTIERAEGVPRTRRPTLQVIRDVLEHDGVEFIKGGVRFRDTAQSK